VLHAENWRRTGARNDMAPCDLDGANDTRGGQEEREVCDSFHRLLLPVFLIIAR